MPEPADQKAPRGPRKSRRDTEVEHGREPALPPLDWGGYLVEYLFEFGPTMAAGMGAGPLTPSEIEAAQRVLGVQFQPWESRLLLRLSRDYLAESYKATAMLCPPPWQDPTTVDLDRAEIARRLEQAMLDDISALED